MPKSPPVEVLLLVEEKDQEVGVSEDLIAETGIRTDGNQGAEVSRCRKVGLAVETEIEIGRGLAVETEIEIGRGQEAEVSLLTEGLVGKIKNVGLEAGVDLLLEDLVVETKKGCL